MRIEDGESRETDGATGGNEDELQSFSEPVLPPGHPDQIRQTVERATKIIKEEKQKSKKATKLRQEN